MRVHGKPTNSPPLRCNFLIPQPWYKIGIEFLQLLFGFQLVWTTGQQHIAVPRLIQPQALAGMLGGRPHSLAMCHFIERYGMFHFIERYGNIINITVNKKPNAKTNQSPIVSTAHWIRL